MADTITESFCERCGTRYEFKAPTRLNPLRKTRGLIGGLKNYVMSQDALSDAVGDAMRSEEERLAAAQLEAFHESFNFCIDCRQYTCLNCWNDAAGRCRTCAPVAGTDDLAERVAASLAGEAATSVADPLLAGPELGDGGGSSAGLDVDNWPTSDLPPVPISNGHAAEAWPTADGFVYEVEPSSAADPARAADGFVYETPPPPAALTPFAEAEAEPVVEEQLEPVVAAELEPEAVAAELEAVAAELDLEPEAAEQAALTEELESQPVLPPLRVVAWDDDAAYDLEPEPISAEEAVAAEPVAAELEPEPFVAEELQVEPEPVAAELEPEPEPVAAELEPEPEPVLSEELEREPLIAEQVEPEPHVAEEFEIEPAVAAELEREPEPVVAEDVELEAPVAEEADAEPTLEKRPEPEPTAPRPIAPISETILRFPRQATPTAPPRDSEAVAAETDSPELAARRAQLDMLGLGDPGEGPVPSRPTVLPYRSRGAGVAQGELATRAAAQGTTFWEASAREVASAAANVGVQNCGQCGLSLSANARFCRRCGTRQAQSA